MENKQKNDNNNKKANRKTDKTNIIIILAIAIFTLQAMIFISTQATNELENKQQKVMYKVKN